MRVFIGASAVESTQHDETPALLTGAELRSRISQHRLDAFASRRRGVECPDTRHADLIAIQIDRLAKQLVLRAEGGVKAWRREMAHRREQFLEGRTVVAARPEHVERAAQRL